VILQSDEIDKYINVDWRVVLQKKIKLIKMMAVFVVEMKFTNKKRTLFTCFINRIFSSIHHLMSLNFFATLPTRRWHSPEREKRSDRPPAREDQDA
jgi:hypothetical protein